MIKPLAANKTRPDDIPADVWDLATKHMCCMGWWAPSMIEGAARAVLEYQRRTDISRYRCAVDGTKRTTATILDRSAA